MKQHTLVNLAEFCEECLIDMRYAAEKNFFKTALYDSNSAWLLEATAAKLARAAAALKTAGFSLLILDAYRPLSVQQKMWDILPDSSFVAPMSRGSIHNRGAAVDVSLADFNGEPVEMPSDFDDFSEKASHSYALCTELAKKHRALLRQGMENAGFRAYEAEWWHYTDTEQKSMPLMDIPLSELECLSKK